MKNISKGLIIAFSLVPCWAFSQKTVSIDVKRDVHSISPYIYGTNESYDGATATRWGGNRSTSYNWENNASNGGNDYNFSSDNFYDYTGTSSPAYPILTATKQADSKRQYNLVSLQAAGYVAADKNGVVTEEQIAPSERWKAISFHKDTEKYPYTLTPDLTDDTVYIDELINYLSVKLGRAGDGGVSAYAIDNEPYLWNQTHARLHPEKTSPDELIKKTVELSTVIRNLAPGADIYGPMFFGWTDAYRWGLTQSEWDKIRLDENYKSKYSWFVDYYLDTLHKVEQETGHRAIDAIAFHWYPESFGATTKKRIVDLDGTSTQSDLVKEDMITARLQAPRGLWDSKYTYLGNDGKSSYVCTQGGKAILSKIKASVDKFYPGTKIAFTEFEYDAENHWSGGLCLADVLGVLGREDVYLACKWDVFQSYSIAAYNLYLNYDGKGNKYGTTSVYAMQSDTVAISSFASLDDEKNLHIIAINKTNEAQNTSFEIENGIYSNGVVYGFDKNTSDINYIGTIDEIQNSTFSYSLPAYSALHFILNAVPQTTLAKAQVVEPNHDEILLTFEDNISSTASLEDLKGDFAVTINETEYTVNSILISGNTLTIKLDGEISSSDNNIYVSYTGENIIGKSNLPIEIFLDTYVYNEVNGAPIYVLSTNIDEIGSFIKMTVSKEIENISNSGGILIQQNNEDIAIDSIKLTNNYTIYVYPSKRIVRYYNTILSNVNSTDIVAKDGSGFSDFSYEIRGGANYAPNIDSAVVFDNYTVKLYFDSNMNPDIDYMNAGMVISDGEQNYEFTSAYSKNIRVATLTTTEMLASGVNYTLSYTDNGEITTIHNGVLESLNINLKNNIIDYGATVVEVPGIIQAEQYWSRIGDPVIEESTDTSSLGTKNTLGYISNGDLYTYKIKVNESKNYTISIRYASQKEGELNYQIDGEKYHVSLPATYAFTKWSDAYRVIPLPEGEHELILEIVNSGFNINYIQILEGEKYPVSHIETASIPRKGKLVNIFFDTKIAVLPELTDIVFICNDTLTITPSNVELNSNTSILNCQLDATIYKGDKVTLQFSSKSLETLDGGSVNDTTLAVENMSTQIYVPPIPDAVSEIDEDEIIVSPNPAFVNQDFVVATSNGEQTLSYSLISANGKTVKSGSFVGSTTISVSQAGTYSLIVNDGEKIAVKKIIVR